jgi:hypothetical protein
MYLDVAMTVACMVGNTGYSRRGPGINLSMSGTLKRREKECFTSEEHLYRNGKPFSELLLGPLLTREKFTSYTYYMNSEKYQMLCKVINYLHDHSSMFLRIALN